MKYTLIPVLILLSISVVKAQPPEWLSDHMEHMTQGSGTWIADNADYKSNQEPMDAYATEWKWGLGRQSITGRLYGIKDGKDVGTYWEFRTFWNPVEKKAYAYQFGGNGAVGIGEMTLGDDGVLSIEQIFYNPDGSQNKIGHESKDLPGVHETQSFDINEKGEWIKRRFYRWELSAS